MWEVEFFWFVYEEKIQYFQKKINKYFFFILKKILNFFKSLKESKKKKMDIDSDFENTEWYLALKKDLNLKLSSARRSEEKFLYPLFLLVSIIINFCSFF